MADALTESPVTAGHDGDRAFELHCEPPPVEREAACYSGMVAGSAAQMTTYAKLDYRRRSPLPIPLPLLPCAVLRDSTVIPVSSGGVGLT